MTRIRIRENLVKQEIDYDSYLSSVVALQYTRL